MLALNRHPVTKGRHNMTVKTATVSQAVCAGVIPSYSSRDLRTTGAQMSHHCTERYLPESNQCEHTNDATLVVSRA